MKKYVVLLLFASQLYATDLPSLNFSVFSNQTSPVVFAFNVQTSSDAPNVSIVRMYRTNREGVDLIVGESETEEIFSQSYRLFSNGEPFYTYVSYIPEKKTIELFYQSNGVEIVEKTLQNKKHSFVEGKNLMDSYGLTLSLTVYPYQTNKQSEFYFVDFTKSAKFKAKIEVMNTNLATNIGTNSLNCVRYEVRLTGILGFFVPKIIFDYGKDNFPALYYYYGPDSAFIFRKMDYRLIEERYGEAFNKWQSNNASSNIQ